MQGVENSELVYAPACETTPSRCAQGGRWLWKTHSCWTTRHQTTGSSRQGPTWWRQRLGSPVVGAGWQQTPPCHGRPAERNEWDARPHPAARAVRSCLNPPSGWGMWKALPAVWRALPALRPSSRLNFESNSLGKLPSPIFDAAGSRRLLRRGGQPRARPRSCNAVLIDRPRTHKYQLAPPSARLQEQGMTPLLPPRGRSPHHFSVEFFKKRDAI